MTAEIDITKEQRKTIFALLRRFIPDVEVWAYGSRVKWTARPNSDLDLVVLITPEQRQNVSELKEALSESDLPFLVDLHVWDEVPGKFRSNIKNEYVVFQKAREAKSAVGLPNGWIDTTIGEQATLQRGIDITRTEQRPGAVPVISSGGVSSFHDTPAAFGPGVVLGRKGVVGSVYFVKSDYWPHDTTLWVKDFHGNDRRFVYYFFKGMAPRIATMDVGSANPTLNRNHVHPIEIHWPPFQEQCVIAHTLGTLDDKIELNRRMNETLKAMARTLFKSWFVNFDPVSAKAEGRDSGLPKHIADLFPDSFENSMLGEIPKGWHNGQVGDLCGAIYSGGTPGTQNPDYWDGDLRWLSSGETREKFITHTERGITSAGVSNSSTRLAPALSTVIASAGQGNTRGQTSLLLIDSYVNQSVVVLTADPKKSSPFHLFFDLERRYEEFRQISDGHSSRGSLTTKLLAGLPAILPPAPVVQCFDANSAAAIRMIEKNLTESHTLAAVRDALLPKLISGELRVKNAERFIAESMND